MLYLQMLKHLTAQPPANLVFIAHKPFNDITAETVDLIYIAELLPTELYNLPGLQSAVEKQIGQALFSRIGEQTLDNVP